MIKIRLAVNVYSRPPKKKVKVKWGREGEGPPKSEVGVGRTGAEIVLVQSSLLTFMTKIVICNDDRAYTEDAFNVRVYLKQLNKILSYEKDCFLYCIVF